eukprot:m.140327 g.140327  ORF g.140327 m.140327 type:complete len:234 (-) comp24105_c1_seq2:464-1165(-)
MVQKATEFLDNATALDQPFYLNLWMHMSHDTLDPSPDQLAAYPLQETCPYRAKMAGQATCPQQIFWSSQFQADWHIKMILDKIDSLGIRNNTLIILSTDNGAQKWQVVPNAVGSQGPFRGEKASIYEGGIRVPFIASWPGKIQQNKISDALIGSVDLLPTVLSVTGSSHLLPPDAHLSGEDISDALFGKKNWQRAKPLFWFGANGGGAPCWNIPPQLAMRPMEVAHQFHRASY